MHIQPAKADIDPLHQQLHDAGLGELIPDGTFAKVMLKIRPGGSNGRAAMDAGLLKASKHSDAKMLDCELTVSDLEAVASVAISRFVVLASHKIREAPGQHEELENLLMY